MEDKQFTTQFIAVLAFLFAFTIIILVIANSMYNSDAKLTDNRVQQDIADRIQPVGQVYIGEVPAAAGQVVASEAKAVAVAMKRLGTNGIEYDDFWDIMDYLSDCGMQEVDDAVEVIRHHVLTMSDGEKEHHMKDLGDKG